MLLQLLVYKKRMHSQGGPTAKLAGDNGPFRMGAVWIKTHVNKIPFGDAASVENSNKHGERGENQQSEAALSDNRSMKLSWLSCQVSDDGSI